MTDHPSPPKPGLTDAEFAVHPTNFASEALKDRIVIVSGAAGNIGRLEHREAVPFQRRRQVTR